MFEGQDRSTKRRSCMRQDKVGENKKTQPSCQELTLGEEGERFQSCNGR